MEKKKILIIDDEADFTRLVKLNLEQTGKYEVKIENDGAQGVVAARMFKPDLILLDIIMPDTEGSIVAYQIKSDKDFKDTPIVFLTAAVLKEEVASQGGMISGYFFIAKPVNTKELISCIEKNLHG